MPDSVFSAGQGVSSVNAWYSTNIEEVLSNTAKRDFHIFVADAVKSFDAVDRDILDCIGKAWTSGMVPQSLLLFHREVWLL